MASEEKEPLSAKPDTSADWTFDDIFKSLGEFGKYQICIYLAMSIVYTSTAMQLLGWRFVGADPEQPTNCTQQQGIISPYVILLGLK